jgi:UDP-glucose 4-epimerase
MRALVTGGAGFIGSHIAEALWLRGDSVVILDNLSTGRRDNLAWAGGDTARLEFIEGDVSDGDVVERAIRGCDWVFHQAAIASVPQSVAQPVATHEANLTGALRLLDAAHRHKVRRLVFASSSAIYGDQAATPKTEGLPPQPLTPYALQKYAAERYGQIYHQLQGLETVALRYFNVFGPRQSFDSPYSGVIARFCTAALEGKTPTIFGDGLQSRDFVYVANVVQANLLAASAPAERAAGRVFNIGTGQSITLLDLIGRLSELTGRPIQPMFAPARAGDIRVSESDITPARRELGFDPKVGWQEGLAHTLDFYRRPA